MRFTTFEHDSKAQVGIVDAEIVRPIAVTDMVDLIAHDMPIASTHPVVLHELRCHFLAVQD